MAKTSRVLMIVVGVLWLVSTLGSAWVAYFSPQRHFIAGKPVLEQPISDDFKTAIRAQRGTAAAYGAAFATLYLLVAIGPYRRGEKWAWWALVVSTLVLLVLTLPRLPTLHTALGVGAAALPFGLTLLALLLDINRLRRH